MGWYFLEMRKGRVRGALTIFALVLATLFPISGAKAYDLNRCLYLNGGSYLQAKDLLIPVTEAFTVEMWAYSEPANKGKFAHFISQGEKPWPFYLGVAPNGNLRAGDSWLETGVAFPEKQWTHLAFTYEGNGKANLYLNGELKASKSDYRVTNGPTFTRLGSQYGPTPNEFFTGCIDDVRIFRGAKAENVIRESMRLSTEQFQSKWVANRSIVTYSFDQSVNYESATTIYAQIPDSGSGISGPATLELRAPTSPVQARPRSELVSIDPLKQCLNIKDSVSSLMLSLNNPLIYRIVNRSNTDMTVDLDLTRIPDKACVGVDLYIKGSGYPISSTVGIRDVKEPLRDRLSVDMTPVKCYYNKTEQANHPYIIRSWYSLDGRTSVYTSEFELKPCSELESRNPADPTRVMKHNETISLVTSESQGTLYARQATMRAQAQGLLNSTFPNGRKWKVYEDWGCHARVKNVSVEVFEDGRWRRVTTSQDYQTSNGCPSSNPFNPYATISLKDGQLFRWKIDGGWLAYSPIRAFFANESVSEKLPADIVNPDPKLTTITSNKVSSASTTATFTRPRKPSFKGVNFSGNKINISVNIGDTVPSRPERVFLVAPKLGLTAENPLAGAIKGNTASWAIELDKLLAGTMIPLEIIGEKNGMRSESLTGSYEIPKLTTPPKALPPTPTNFKSRIVGTAAVITAEAKLSAESIASSAFLFSKTLGISKSNALEGEVVGNKVVIEVPIKPTMAGKNYPVTIFLKNSVGESKPLNATLRIPAAPKAPSIPSGVTVPTKAPETILCKRGSQTRAFAGNKCPPGWEPS